MYSCDLCDYEGKIADYETFEDFFQHSINEHDYNPGVQS